MLVSVVDILGHAVCPLCTNNNRLPVSLIDADTIIRVCQFCFLGFLARQNHQNPICLLYVSTYNGGSVRGYSVVAHTHN